MALGRYFGGCLGPVHSAVRTAGLEALTQTLKTSRTRTLGLMQAWKWPCLICQCHLGTHSALSGVVFDASHLPNADALFNSSEVAHDSRWTLALPDLAETQAYLAQTLQRSLDHLQALHFAGSGVKLSMLEPG
jgi:gamma-glutamyl hercynylcysteine S-oxide synthase